MDHEHQPQADIGHHDEAAQLDDVLQVGTGHHLGHQRQHAIRRQFHHQAHQTHHPGLQGIDGIHHLLALFGVVLEQLQRGNAHEGGEDHHADDRGRLGPGQVGERILRNERQQQLRDIQVGDLARVVGLDGLQAGQFLGAGDQALGGQAEQVGQADPDQRGDGGGEQQRANGQEADLAQGRSIVQAGHGAEDRGEHQRDDDHLQQLHITVAHQVEPGDGGLEYRAAITVDGMQARAENHPQYQGEQDLLRQAPGGVAGLCQAQQQGEEHQQIEDQRQVHEDSENNRCPSLLALYGNCLRDDHAALETGLPDRRSASSRTDPG